MIQGSTDPFWPTTLNQWLGALSILLITGGGTLVASWRWLLQPMKDDIKDECTAREAAIKNEIEARKHADDGIGGRVQEVADKSTRHEERLTMLERAKELAEERGTVVAREMGSLNKAVTELAVIVNNLERERLQAQGALMAEMAKLNGKLDLLAQIRTHNADH